MLKSVLYLGIGAAVILVAAGIMIWFILWLEAKKTGSGTTTVKMAAANKTGDLASKSKEAVKKVGKILQHSQGKVSQHILKFGPKNTNMIGQFEPQATSLTPTSFKMKFIAAYLSEDIDPVTQNNTGNSSMFFINKECNDNISGCGIDATSTERITTFFDFSQSTSDVNAQLNAQGRTVTPGTYKYVRLEFCKYGADSPNVQFQSSGMASAHEFAIPSCTTTVAIVPPLVVNTGDNLTLTLGYDLTDTVTVNASYTGESNCTNTSPSYCFQIPTYIPTVTKN